MWWWWYACSAPEVAPPACGTGDCRPDIVQIAVGDAFGCARRLNGDVACWGRNQDGQLGTGSFAELAGSNIVLRDAVGLSAGARHACALRVGGGVSCWGANEREQVAREAGDWAAPVLVALPGPMVEVAAGWTTSCARAADGAVWCWGDDVPSPRRIPGVVATGLANGRASCALEADGDVACWQGVTPTKHPLGASALAADREVAALADGRILVWTPGGEAREVGRVAGATGLAVVRGGVYVSSRNGELWGFTTGDGPVPLPVGRGQEIAGRGHSACARVEGAVSCWGPEATGLVPRGVLRPRPLPAGAPTPSDPTLGRFSCAVDLQGEVTCGEGEDGRRQVIAGLPPVTEVAVGANLACAAAGGVWCWNHWRAGVVAGSAPVAVGVIDAVSIAVGQAHGCALTGDGAVWCWGANERGQLGDGTTRGRTNAARVELEGPAKRIALGSSSSCAELVSGRTLCWGHPAAFGERAGDNPADHALRAPVR